MSPESHTDETKEKIRQRLKAYWTPERREARRQLYKGRPLADRIGEEAATRVAEGSRQRALKKGRWSESRSSKKYEEFRDGIFEKRGKRCQDCGGTTGRIHIHHIKDWDNFPTLRYVESNIEVLCIVCHMKRPDREA
jgi:5-methylcytosine-specific restriction endonuclease McrA